MPTSYRGPATGRPAIAGIRRTRAHQAAAGSPGRAPSRRRSYCRQSSSSARCPARGRGTRRRRQCPWAGPRAARHRRTGPRGVAGPSARHRARHGWATVDLEGDSARDPPTPRRPADQPGARTRTAFAPRGQLGAERPAGWSVAPVPRERHVRPHLAIGGTTQRGADVGRSVEIGRYGVHTRAAACLRADGPAEDGYGRGDRHATARPSTTTVVLPATVGVDVRRTRRERGQEQQGQQATHGASSRSVGSRARTAARGAGGPIIRFLSLRR